MDCLFNKSVPNEEKLNDKDKTFIILKPISKTFINGMSSYYNITYREDFLSNCIIKREYYLIMERLMDILYMSWPCCLCYTSSYMFFICTLGLTCIYPSIKILKAKRIMLDEINDINKEFFNKKGINLSYKSNCLTSWLVINKIQKIDNVNIDCIDNEFNIKDNNCITDDKINAISHEKSNIIINTESKKYNNLETN